MTPNNPPDRATAPETMKIVVIGSGLIGVTTAYCLSLRGHQVTVLDRADGPARETSFANGAMLTPGMAEPWNAPGSWRVLLGSLGRSDAALQLHLRALPSLARWGTTFLSNSRTEAFERNTLSTLRLALYSREVMQSLRGAEKIDYGRSALGSLSIFRDQGGLDRACAAADRRASAGSQFQRLSAAQTAQIEPALAPIADQLAGAIHYVLDETGDAHRFCEALTGAARRRGVEFHFGAEVLGLDMRAGEVAAAACRGRRFVADRYVVAAGSYSTPLLRRAGVNLPVRPVKGYTVTFEDSRARPSLRMPIIDSQAHAVLVPLDGAMRLAGAAEFAGYDRSIDTARIRHLLTLLPAVLPKARFDAATAKPWCGLRPLSADGVAIIGPTPIRNLWVNSGHGHLGWTTAAGSAQIIADQLSGIGPAIDPAPYALARFGKASGLLSSPPPQDRRPC